jgi:hypothetical protein
MTWRANPGAPGRTDPHPDSCARRGRHSDGRASVVPADARGGDPQLRQVRFVSMIPWLHRNQGLVWGLRKNHGDRLSREDVATAYDDRHDSCLANDGHGLALRRHAGRRRLVGRSPVGSREDDLEQPWLELVDLGTGIAQPRDAEDGPAELQQSPGWKGKQIQTAGEDVLTKITRPKYVAQRPRLIEELGVDEMDLTQVGLVGVAPHTRAMSDKRPGVGVPSYSEVGDQRDGLHWHLAESVGRIAADRNHTGRRHRHVTILSWPGFRRRSVHRSRWRTAPWPPGTRRASATSARTGTPTWWESAASGGIVGSALGQRQTSLDLRRTANSTDRAWRSTPLRGVPNRGRSIASRAARIASSGSDFAPAGSLLRAVQLDDDLGDSNRCGSTMRCDHWSPRSPRPARWRGGSRTPRARHCPRLSPRP